MDQRGDGVERVEQEVRVDLRAQRLELRAAGLEPEPLGDLFLLLAFALQPHVLEHEAEDVGQRSQHGQVFAEQRASAWLVDHGQPDPVRRRGDGHLRDPGLDLGQRLIVEEDQHAASEHLGQRRCARRHQRGFVGGLLHDAEHVLDRFDGRELAAQPEPIEQSARCAGAATAAPSPGAGARPRTATDAQSWPVPDRAAAALRRTSRPSSTRLRIRTPRA